MKGLILLLIALTLFIPLTILNVILVFKKYQNWKSMDGYFYETAYDIDRFGNHNFRTVLNRFLVKKGGHQFGDLRDGIKRFRQKPKNKYTYKIRKVACQYS